MDWGGLSHTGYERAVNTDCFYVGRFDRTLEPVLTSLSHAAGVSWHHISGYCAIVTDGIAEGSIGEVASRTAIGTLLELILDTPDWVMRLDDATLVGQVSARVKDRLAVIDQLLTSIGAATLSPGSMGTTMTIVGLLPPDGVVAHVGHSRAYLEKSGTLRRLTRDRMAARVLTEASLAEAQRATDPSAPNPVVRAVGLGQGQLDVDVERFTVAPGDRVVVCSDGLIEAIADDELNEVLSASASSALACRALVDLALARGGRDNVTAVVGRIPG